MHTLEKNVVATVQNEVDKVMKMVETRVQNAVLTAMEILQIARVEFAMKSVNASSERGVDSFVLDRDQRDFSRNVEDLQMTVFTRINSHRDLNRFDETRGNITVTGGDFSVNER